MSTLLEVDQNNKPERHLNKSCEKLVSSICAALVWKYMDDNCEAIQDLKILILSCSFYRIGK